MGKTAPAKSGGLRTKGGKKIFDINYPIVSIITVVFNDPHNLEKTIQSIMKQTYKNIEYIIIDGGSTDYKTIEVIKKHEDDIDFWISESDNGIYDAMNKGIRYSSSSTYLNFLNAGDHYNDNETLNSIFSNIYPKQPDLIYGDIYYIALNSKKKFYQKALSFNLENLLQKGTGAVCHQAIFIKKEVCPQYSTRYKFKGELNWYFDIIEKKDIETIYINKPIIVYYLGGFGYKYFLRNRIEWINVVRRRFGITTVFKNKLIGFLYKNSLSRYPLLKKIDAFFTYKINSE